MVKRTERGWAGHFCGATDCLFRRNTLLECRRKRVVVSTVGQYHPKDMSRLEQIGFNRYYETMAFKAKKSGPYWDADVSKEIEFTSEWQINASNPEELPEDVDNLANDMHEQVVKEITELLEKGAI